MPRSRRLALEHRLISQLSLFRKNKRMLLRSPRCCPSVCTSPTADFCLEAYETALLSPPTVARQRAVRVPPNFLFSMRSVLYQRKVGDQFLVKEAFPATPQQLKFCISGLSEHKSTYIISNLLHYGRAVAQAVSRWLPTAVARVRVRAACGVCGGQSGTGAGFLQVLRFPLPITIPPISPSS
jgi:hypothetical protein